MDATGFHVAGLRTPMRFGGTNVPEMVRENNVSIFRPTGLDGVPRVNLPAENPKYPETKHTVKCVRSERRRFEHPPRRCMMPDSRATGSTCAQSHPCALLILSCPTGRLCTTSPRSR